MERDEVTVLNLEGDAVRLAELWTGRTTILAFLRHFG